VFWLGGETFLLSVQCTRNNDDRETEIHTVEPLVPESSAFEFDMAVEELKRYKLINRIPAEFIKSGSRTIRSEIHKRITSSWNKEELPEEWKESIIVPIYKKDDKRDYSNYRGISLCQLYIKLFPTSCCQG